MTTVLKEGWLLKRSQWLKKWNRRYFTLTRRTVAGVASHELSYTKVDSGASGTEAECGGWTLDRSDYGAPEMNDVSGEKEGEQTVQLVARTLKSLAECRSLEKLSAGPAGTATRKAERRLLGAKATKPETVLLRAEAETEFDEWLGLLIECISSSGPNEGGVPSVSSMRAAVAAMPDRTTSANAGMEEDEQMRLALALSAAEAGAGARSPSPHFSAPGYASVASSYPALASSTTHAGDENEQLRRALALSRQTSRSQQGAYAAPLGQLGSSSSSSARSSSSPSYRRPSPAYAAPSPGYSYTHASPSSSSATTFRSPSTYAPPPAATYAPTYSPAVAAAAPPVYAAPPPAYVPAVLGGRAPPAHVIIVDATAVSVQPSPPPQQYQRPPPPTYTPPPHQRAQVETWTCSACTYTNQQGAAACEMCTAPR